MSNIEQLPIYATDLVLQLDKYLPHRCVRSGEPLEDAHRYSGKRDLVDFLLRLLEKDEGHPLKR